MSRRPAFRPHLEVIESRLAPSAAQLPAALAQPYIEQDNMYKQYNIVNSPTPHGNDSSIYMKYPDV